MDDGALTEHQKGPRPVFYKINSRFRRFGCGTGLRARLNGYYISLTVPYTLGGSAVSGPHYLAKYVHLTGPGTISPCIITIDHDAIICFMTDGLTRGPDKDVHIPSVGSQKYPSRRVDVIYS